MEFIKQVIKHDEVKRGASHLLVGIAIAIVARTLFNDGVSEPSK